MHIRLTMLMIAGVLALPAAPARAFSLEPALPDLQPQFAGDERPDHRIAQSNGMSLSEAIASLKRQTDGRIVSAETKTSGGREVHHIKVLTKDGKVKTHKIQGRKRGNG